MKYAFISDLETHLAASYGVDGVDVTAELCPPEFQGDVTVNCFRLARVVRRNPMEIAARAAEFLRDHGDVAAVEAVKAFVNVSLQPGALFRDAVGDAEVLLADALLPSKERKKVLIEFSAPNTNKPLHLGHVRNNALGMALSSILQRAGHDVVPVNLVNDRGIHICKSMVAYQRLGGGETPESTGTKGDHFVGGFYVKFDQELRRQLADLRKKRPELAEREDEELFLETEIGREAQDMLVAWEDGDDAVRTLWRTMNDWVLAGFDQTYERMGTTFRHTYFESDTYVFGNEFVDKGLADGVFTTTEDGAVVIDLEREKLGTKVVRRRDGTSVYVTQDIGTTYHKQQDHSADTQVWIVGDEQIFHFRVLFAILKRLGFPNADSLRHMAYGMVNLPSGKMKSREGTVVDADDLFDEMHRLARKATLERSAPDVPDDLEHRARVIGLGALKFMLLKVNAKTTIMFDPEASIKFEGDTGPYVLYAYARICSMMRKAGSDALAGPVDWSVLGNAEERDLALRCAQYGCVVRGAAAEFDTSRLAGYLLDLAKAFSRFWRACPVLAAPTPELRRARLELSERVRAVLGDGLDALTIGALESM